ncbi:FAD/FMN-containing dehydrogenase [Inquilinus ginsengisoli]|uniref:FAD/FMN-containing dehydrogenase n=1 Tax=Inquilinus ginsengisoli TaxID=363840 RepID=A0ABU1K0Y8_9PROT|nr:FAD-binding oxidoreductase [Inquilinus ginsengisoli]MDR6294528.1 FAD/FMN-containing dehydrogenase [Inquilinus ginsengisoli]
MEFRSAAPAAQSVAALRDFIWRAQGTAFEPGHADHTKACAIWNGAVEHHPALVIPCRSAAEVQLALTGAQAHGVAISVRGGGHDWAGRALRHGGAVIDLSPMRGVTVDVAARTATISGSATGVEVAGAAAPHGLAPVIGNCGAVGAIGHLIGGGYGALTPGFGLAADNLLSAEVVLADGRTVTADPAQNPDLFWALRGGGGNFGVVTSIRIRLHPVAQMLAGMMLFAWPQAEAVLRGYDALMSTAPDALSVTAGVVNAPDGSPVVLLAPAWSGDTAEGQKAIARLRGLGTPILDQIAPMTCIDQAHLQDAFVVNGRHHAIETRWLPDLSAEAIAAIMAAGSNATSPYSGIVLHHFHGAGTRVAAEATAFGLRRRHILVEIVPAWDPGDGTRHRAWARDLSAALAPHALPGGYANLLGPDAQDQIAEAYGPNAERLRQIKRRYDPDNLFSSAIALPR